MLHPWTMRALGLREKRSSKVFTTVKRFAFVLRSWLGSSLIAVPSLMELP
jgi:hypothetical protein